MRIALQATSSLAGENLREQYNLSFIRLDVIGPQRRENLSNSPLEETNL